MRIPGARRAHVVEHGGVDGEHQRLVARRGGAPDHLLDEPGVEDRTEKAAGSPLASWSSST